MSQNHSVHLFTDDPRLPIDLRVLATENGGECASLGLDFAFDFMSLPLRGHYESSKERGRLRLMGPVGPMPFSAESSRARLSLQAIVEAANRHLGQAFLVESGRILLVREMEVASPVCAADLVAAITVLLIPVKPYIEIIATFLILSGEQAKDGAGKIRLGWRQARPNAGSGARRPPSRAGS